MKLLATLLLIISTTTLFSNDLDTLLKEYSQKSDLSEKTKIENSGHLFIYTKNDIENMQAKTLKDVLKSIPAFTYEESKFLFPDIYNSQYTQFNSHTMRIYLDNQELVSGFYGSGLPLYGNMSLGLIDHIEIYLGSPSFKFSTEPSLLIVKLYTKDISKNFGGKFKSVVADDGYNQTWIDYHDFVGSSNYEIFIDYTDDRQDKINYNSNKLSKDKQNFHLYSKYINDSLKINFQAKKESNDAFINFSQDGTPSDSNIDTEVIDFNIEKSFLDNKLLLSLNHSYINTVEDFKDDNTIITYNATNYNSLYKDLDENVTTVKATYENKFSSNNIFLGSDIRRKSLNFNEYRFDNTNINTDFNSQTIYSIYFQDEYYIQNNSILTFGYKYYKSDNDSASIKDSYGKTLRVGHIYTNDNFTFKTYYSDTDMMVEPYLFISTYGNSNLNKMSVKLLSQETIYEKDNNKLSLKIGMSKMIDTIAYNPFSGKVENLSNRMDFNYFVFSDTYQVLNFKNFFSAYYSYRDNIPFVGRYDYKGAQLRTTYNLDKSTFFSEIVYRENDENKKDYYDLSLGVKYKYQKNITLSLKGENILDKSYSTRFDLSTSTPIYSQHIPRRYLVGLEYNF